MKPLLLLIAAGETRGISEVAFFTPQDDEEHDQQEATIVAPIASTVGTCEHRWRRKRRGGGGAPTCRTTEQEQRGGARGQLIKSHRQTTSKEEEWEGNGISAARQAPVLVTYQPKIFVYKSFSERHHLHEHVFFNVKTYRDTFFTTQTKTVMVVSRIFNTAIRASWTAKIYVLHVTVNFTYDSFHGSVALGGYFQHL